MRRIVKITLPYTVCLFAAMLAMLMAVAVTVGVMAYRDSVTSRPELAYSLLSDALAQAIRRAETQIEPAVSFVQLSQRWFSDRTLSADAPKRWAPLLLGPLAEQQAIQLIEITASEELLWQAKRQPYGWSGYWRDTSVTDQTTLNFAMWDALGSSATVGTGESLPTTPPSAPQYSSVLNSDIVGPMSISTIRGSDGTSQVCVVARVRLNAGIVGQLSVLLEPQVLTPIIQSTDSPVAVQFDPQGKRLTGLAPSHTLDLLTRQAVPEEANLALRTLFPAKESKDVLRWYAARPFPVGDGPAWWSVASITADVLPSAPLSLAHYGLAACGVGLLGALIIAVAMGRRISKPMAHIARRARSIQQIDAHYVPWPKSRFTEVNTLTCALEELYETAVEHLDYHEAPLVVWAQPEALSGGDGIIDTHPLKRHINLHTGEGNRAEAEVDDTESTVINVRNDPPPALAIPAAQLQVLHTSRREIRKLQGQLAGASQELRTASTSYQQSEERLRRQRRALRLLDKQIRQDGSIGLTTLSIIGDGLGVRSVSFYRTSNNVPGDFTLRLSTEFNQDTTPVPYSIGLVALLREELVLATRDIQADPRFAGFSSHPTWTGRRCALLVATLRTNKLLLGFLVVEHCQAGSTWKSDEEAFAASCAIHCTMSLAEQIQAADDDRLTPGNGHSFRFKAMSRKEAIEWETDLAGCIKSLSGPTEAVYGYAPKALIGQPITFLSNHVEGERDLTQLGHVLLGKLCNGYRAQHRRANGESITVTIRAGVQRDASGRITGVRGSVMPSRTPSPPIDRASVRF